MFRLKFVLLASAALAPAAAFAQSAPVELPPVDIFAPRPADDPASATLLSRQQIANFTPRTNDLAQTLTNTAGVSLYRGGGVSSLPVIHGLNDDRNAVSVLGGAPLTAACGNHMNPPLSYMDPESVGAVEVLTANVPVSKGGDSIGGSIIVTPRPPVFAPAPGPASDAPTPKSSPFGALIPPGVLVSGSLSSAFRSNGGGLSESGHINVATQHFDLDYTGAWTKSGDYLAGGGARVRSTEYEAQNHAATLSYNNEGQTFSLTYAHQDIPYQGFVNQYMDMLGNQADTVNIAYNGGFTWGRLDANMYWHRTNHYMNFLEDRVGYQTSPTTGMPMYVNGQDYGYKVKAEINASAVDVVRLGNELHLQHLDDYWTPVPGMAPMMCCSTFLSINNGQRNVLGTFVEWERHWTPQWTTLLGLRNDDVFMTTGDVQGYDPMMYGADAAAFNALNHNKTDINFDATALVRFTPAPGRQYEFGYTRKTRSPNLYERYAWSTDTMASTMIGWFGDGNGYVGDVNLKPEVAHTFAATANLSDASEGFWSFKATPYFSYVQNYIDVDLLSPSVAMPSNMAAAPAPINILRFANHDAQLYGVDLSGQVVVARTARLGEFTLSGLAAFTHGVRLDTGSSLYHMAPLNGKVALQNVVPLFGGSLTSVLEVEASMAKTEVEALRYEPTTPGYAIFNMRTAYNYKNVQFNLGVENLTDKLYYRPLDGIDIADWMAVGTPYHSPVAAQGRNVYAGLTVRF
jgi:iron complex outermembrane receptor protein